MIVVPMYSGFCRGVYWFLLSGFVAAGCSALPESAGPVAETARTETARTDGSSQPEILCATVPANDGRVSIRYQIRNVTPSPIHIVDSRRVPYQLARGESTLVILHGIESPGGGVLYPFSEIPLTRPLAPGEIFRGQIEWPQHDLLRHYARQETPATLLHGKIQIRCEAGWWATPITRADREQLTSVPLESQHIVEYGPLEVTLP